ncbi:hypothetical protein [Paenibacillus pinistramenti]|uniref:hypothetical protein n=1 Tax=Paenibacillus pinistramenti TaxID=1768003 RepID=UPI001107CF57|nr:hypothetical protein [Paenibacillus pinistramenti]
MLDRTAVNPNSGHPCASLSDELCGDIVTVLGVPRIPGVFSLLEPFGLGEAWLSLRKYLVSPDAEAAAQVLRQQRLAASPPLIDWRNLYSPGTFEQLRSTVLSRYEANPRLLLMITLWIEGLSGRLLRGTKQEVYKESDALPKRTEVNARVLKDLHIENALSTKILLNEIAAAHSGAELPEDYRLLAAYPEFLRIHWGYLKTHLKSAEYAGLQQKMISQASVFVQNSSYDFGMDERLLPMRIHSEDCEQAETEKARLLELLLLLQNQLAGMVLEIGFIRDSLR